MPKLIWDATGERRYETGVKNGVLYPQVEGAYPKGVAWNGLSSVSEKPSGAEPNPIYADDMKWLNLVSVEDFAASIEAYMYPDEFDACLGNEEIVPGVTIGQQNHQSFGLAYRTIVGNDTERNNHGYKIHIIYGATAAPSERQYQTVNDSPEPMALSFELSTVPVPVPGKGVTANFTLDSTKTDAKVMAAVEAVLFGSDEADARLPLPEELIQIMTAAVEAQPETGE
jgi:hypothetical protein